MTHRRRARTRFLTLTAIVLIAGCGGSSGTTTTTNNASSSSSSGLGTSPPPGCSNPTSAFGAVCSVSGQAAVGTDTSPGGGTPINQGDPISTMSGSSILFWISVKIRKCDIYPPSNGKLIIWPISGPPHLLIHLLAGHAVCSTVTSNGPQFLAVGQLTTIKLNDPVFAFAIDPTGVVTIQVISGSLSVSTDVHPQPVTVAAGRQVSVVADGKIVAPIAFSLSSLPPQEQAAIALVEK